MPTPSSRPVIFYGWVIVATTFLIALVTVGGRSAYGVFVVPMSEAFGWSRSTISLAATIGFLVNGLSQPVMGKLFDTFGGRKVILVSLAAFGVTTMLLALTFHLLFLIMVFGVLMSMAWSGASLTTTSALVSRWFQRKRATVLSLSTAGASAGGLLLVPLAMAVLQRTDWRLTWVVLGALVLVVALPLALAFLKDNPTDLGLRPDGDQPSADDREFNPVRAAVGPLETDTWHAALRSRPFWQLAGAYGVCSFTTAILTTHFIPYAIDRGVAPSTAATVFGVMNGLNVVGVIVMGMLANRCGRKNLLALVYAGRGGAYALLLLAPDPWGLWGFAAIAGFSYWATAPLTTSLTADLYGLKTLGTLSGLTFLVHQVGGAATIQFAGLMRDIAGSCRSGSGCREIVVRGRSMPMRFHLLPYLFLSEHVRKTSQRHTAALFGLRSPLWRELRWLPWGGSLIGVLLLVSYSWPHEGSPLSPPKMVRQTVTGEVPNIALVDQSGRPLALKDLRGKGVLLTFIYTSCPDVCSLTTAAMTALQQRLAAEERERVFFLSITTEPEIDTPEVLQAYASRHGADLASWAFLTGSPQAVQEVWRSFGLPVKRVAERMVEHPAYTLLIDRQGMARYRYLGETLDVEIVLEDLRRL